MRLAGTHLVCLVLGLAFLGLAGCGTDPAPSRHSTGPHLAGDREGVRIEVGAQARVGGLEIGVGGLTGRRGALLSVHRPGSKADDLRIEVGQSHRVAGHLVTLNGVRAGSASSDAPGTGHGAVWVAVTG